MIDLASIPSLMRLGLFELGRKVGLFRGLNHTLLIKAYDRRGKLKAIRFVRQKLMLNNFRNLLGEIFHPEVTLATTTRAASLVEMGGLAKSIPVFSTISIPDYYAMNFIAIEGSTVDLGARIRIGTGTIAPARDDYALQSEVADGIPTQTIGADYIAWSVAITLTTAQDISEAGLSCRYCNKTDTPEYSHFLLFRDTFTPVSVGAGGAISITERLTF